MKPAILLLITLLIILPVAYSQNTDWSMINNIGIGTYSSTTEANLDLNGTLQLRRTGDADVNNQLQNSGSLTFQTGFWNNTAHTSKWTLRSNRLAQPMYLNSNNRSEFSISQADNSTKRFILDDDGSFQLNGYGGESAINYDPLRGLVNITPSLLTTTTYASVQVIAPLYRGYNYVWTMINLDQPGISYKATCDCGVANTAHKFTILNPALIAGSNIATFDNGAAPLVRIDKDGNLFATQKLLIGNNDLAKVGSYALAVNGDVLAKKVRISISNTFWPDYVFQEKYELPKLSDLEKYIKLNQHLPEIPSALEVEKNGIDLGENQTMLLKKIEELTLILIDQNKRLDQQSDKISQLEKVIKSQK
jgi:hypothetical protein